MQLGSLLMVFIVGLLPVAEVRGAIPLAFALFSDDSSRLLLGVALGIVGNLLIAPLVLSLLDYVEKWVMYSKRSPEALRRIYRWVLNIARRRAESIKSGGYIALAIFVTVPLPVTGAWTGSLIAYLLGMDRKRAVAAIELGVLGASAIVFTAVYTGLEVLKRVFMLP